MRKPPYLSNKKWNKKFQKNVKKFQNLVNPSNEDRIDKPSGLRVDNSVSGTSTLLKKCTFFLCLLSFVKKAFSYVFVNFTQIINGMNDCRAQEITIVKNLEVRLEKLEKTLKENVKEIQSLRLQVAEHTERLEKLTDQQKTTNMGFLLDKSKLQLAEIPTSSVQLPVLLPAPVPFFTSAAPPPPPPPPPPFGALGVKNQLVLKNTSAVRKPSQKPQTMRPAISLEDIISVKLKKTPFAQRNERLTKLTPSSELHRISLEALRSVKLKKTPALLKETSPVKSKSPKGKIRHVLRRLPITLSPGGTPKGGRSNVIYDQDDITPVMTRALLKRFDAFQMSPDSEENKENDVQFM